MTLPFSKLSWLHPTPKFPLIYLNGVSKYHFKPLLDPIRLIITWLFFTVYRSNSLYLSNMYIYCWSWFSLLVVKQQSVSETLFTYFNRTQWHGFSKTSSLDNRMNRDSTSICTIFAWNFQLVWWCGNFCFPLYLFRYNCLTHLSRYNLFSPVITSSVPLLRHPLIITSPPYYLIPSVITSPLLLRPQ